MRVSWRYSCSRSFPRKGCDRDRGCQMLAIRVPVPHRDAPALAPGRYALIPHHHQPVRPGLRAPGFARPAEHLAHRRAALVRRKALEYLARGIEAQDGVRDEIGHPDLVLIVDVDRVAAALAVR